MTVAIVGFSRVEDIDAEMQKLIAESGCYLFNVMIMDAESAAAEWARQNGAPVVFVKSVDDVLKSDFLLINIGDGGCIPVNNLFMRYKRTGKHGRCAIYK